MNKIFFLLVILVFVFGCTNNDKNITIDDTLNQAAECSADSDCATAGCSGQVCTIKADSADIITTCEYRQEYDCLKQTSCSCIDGKCQWQQTKDYLDCMQNIGPEDDVVIV